MINLAIVEDNASYSKSLLDIIELAEGMTCIGSFQAAETCLKALKEGTLPSPTVLLLDLNLPGEHGLKMLPLLKKQAQQTEIIILTQNSKFQTVLEALHLGATGYLVKGASVQEIRQVIRDVAKGGTYIDPQLSRAVLNVLCGQNTPKQSPLSPREIEILELLAQGFCKKEVADKIGISYHTVTFHVRGVFEKLETPNLTAAVAKATRQKLI
ncbi:MAG: response regulator [Coraliomargarita sp.]